MTQLRNWLGLVRIDTIFATLLAMGSYPGLPTGSKWLVVLTVGAIFAATMLQNALDDCVQDFRRGGDRQFAKNNEATLCDLTVYAWLSVVALVVSNAFVNSWWESFILLGMGVGGRFYGDARTYPGLSMMVVAVVFTAPLFLGAPKIGIQFLLNAAVFFILIMMIELRCDLRDHEYDKNDGYGKPWKKTIPVLLGSGTTNVFYFCLAAAMLGIQITSAVREFQWFVSIPASPSQVAIITGVFAAVLSSVGYLFAGFESKVTPEGMKMSALFQKAALTLFILAFLMD